MLHALKIGISCLLLPALLRAYPFEAEALGLLQETERSKACYLKEAEGLHLRAQSIVERNLHAPHGCSQPSMGFEQPVPQKATSYPLLIFVSLSMPEASLKSLYQDAQQQGGVLVLRGLQDNSFKKTAERLRTLGIALQIDPVLFRRYEVKNVPTFIGIHQEAVHRLTGNVSLAYVLHQFEEKS